MSNECEHEWAFADTQWQTPSFMPSGSTTVQQYKEYAYYYCSKCLLTVKKEVGISIPTNWIETTMSDENITLVNQDSNQ